MQVILREPVQNLGNIGDLVNVKAGYARNFLLPFNKAMPATAENVKEIETRKAEFEKEAAEVKANAESIKLQLNGKSFTIFANIGDEGKLFGSVGSVEVIAALNEAGHDIAKSAIRLAEGPIHQAGEHSVGIHLHSDIDDAVITIDIQQDNSNA